MTDEIDESGALEASGLGKKYRRGWALRDVAFRLPAGRICALVGPNGSGKSTLLSLAAGLLTPTTGTLRVFGRSSDAPGARARIAFVAQDKPLYPRFSVADTLRLGRELNPRWDQKTAERVVAEGEVPLSARVGSLSGGQRTCVALAMALGKRADLLLLDEPMSDQDPLRRHRMMGVLMAEAAERGTGVVISTHVLAELDGVCDHLLLMGGGRIRLAGEADAVQAAHRLVTGPRAADGGTPDALARHTVVETRTTGRQLTALIRPADTPAGDGWIVTEPSLEDVLLGYLRAPDAPPLFTADARTTGTEVEA
ncbi:ATP-binding cassette domain-containing protein [Streptomyces sp. SID8382]|uniref:ABC transporter ATP-binding protein n=1 Tax=Streptomyces malaysiensis TaxID=92644 RepID=UPI000C2C34A4|nr:ABC transporter ATP-binding protein [Streptomyces sp. M56]AUA14503.1 putative ABC transporter ATP-binding protein YxlF [Streptomyces sp. M56]MYX60885.1 ATP-binding cassette domain-containing protein [Streptomyces sp. SID8382]